MTLKANKSTDYEVFQRLEYIESQTITAGWSAEGFKSEALKDNGLVYYNIDEKGEIIGLLTAYLAIDEANITNVAVLEPYRRNGVAQKLLDTFFLENLKDVKEIFLEVRESNISAKNLYIKNGFEQIAIRKNFYSNPTENAIIMKKKAG